MEMSDAFSAVARSRLSRRQVRHRHRDRHGSNLVLRFHHGRCALTQSSVPQFGQARSKQVSREQLVAETVAVELLISAGDDAGVGDGGSQKIRKRCGRRGHGPS